ncbi:hypothetical protein B1R94_05760 [Mycolicibacterium litorale]|nr:hypothetical protein B1R94_05760 [Mycolicibacterium litorale]
MPPSGCAAVPLLKKTLSSESNPPATSTAGEAGVLVTDADTTAVARESGATRVTESAIASARTLDEGFLTVPVVPAAGRDDPLRIAPDELGRGFVRAGPACTVDFAAPADEPLEAADPFECALLPVSADATAGMAAIAAPTPSATAEAPIQVKTLSCPADCGSVMPPNSAGSTRRSSTPSVMVWTGSVERIWAAPG